MDTLISYLRKPHCIFIAALALVVTLSASAGPIDRGTARQQAADFLQNKGLSLGKEPARVMGRRPSMSQEPLYIFNAADSKGFVIIAGDDRIDPVVGYTTQGSYDDNTLPDNFRGWLEQMSAEIEAFVAEPDFVGTSSARLAPARTVAIHSAISPLIQTTWDQGNNDNVYNSHLPLVNGQLPCTGCVATAGAQIMYYYHNDLPARTKIVSGYTLLDEEGNDISNGADTSNDLPAISFKWNLMQPSYSYKDPSTPNSPAEDAVADLMLYCAYAAKMNFGTAEEHGGSSAGATELAEGMSLYFGFNPEAWENASRNKYSISEWDELIYNELANGRPVLYNGSYNGGHAFICDGYDGEGLYHFNWGWGGQYNGYFKLQATNPYGESNPNNMGYILNNSCIIGLQPVSWPYDGNPNADDTWEVPEITGIVATASNVSVSGTTVTMNVFNFNADSYAFGYGIGKLNDDGTITTVDTSKEAYKNYGALEYGSGYGLSFNFSSYNLPNGKHHLVPISILKGENVWRRCKSADLYFEVNVSGGNKTVTAHPIENIQISDFGLVGGGVPGVNQYVKFNVTNNGDNIEKDLYVFDGSTYKNMQTIRIASGNTKEYRLYIGALSEGNHTLMLKDAYRNGNVLAQKAVAIRKSLAVTHFEVGEPRFVNTAIRVDVTVANNAGDYNLPLYLLAGMASSSSKSLRYVAGTAIESGGSEVVTFYFKPNQTGQWKLYVATDSQGSNVIGTLTMTVSNPPTGTVTLQMVSSSVECNGNTATYTMNIKNTSSTTYYKDILSRIIEEGNNDGVFVKSPKVIIAPGETKEVVITYPNLTEGKAYTLDLYYLPTYNASTYNWFYSDDFTVADSSLPGDLDGDGVVSSDDVAALVRVILGKATPSDGYDLKAADVNKDNVVTIADITALVNIALGQ